jgi:c(7)-type cytochrome triheme protein
MKSCTHIRFVRATAIFALLGLIAAGALSLAGDGLAQQKQPQQPQQSQPQKSPANVFNRLMKTPTTAKNSPPAEDGIHDPQNPGTALLQWPSEAFSSFPKSNDGNLVDWVATLKQGKIAPWFDFENRSTEPFLFDLVIVREVKGSMPNVVFPHEAHTQWLDCSNCHDEIFVPEKGANQISMAAILLGQKCGVCHGRVAFPVTDCRRCHSQPKTAEELRALADKSNWTKASNTSAKK